MRNPALKLRFFRDINDAQRASIFARHHMLPYGYSERISEATQLLIFNMMEPRITADQLAKDIDACARLEAIQDGKA